MLSSLAPLPPSYTEGSNTVKLQPRSVKTGTGAFLSSSRGRNSRSGPRGSIHETYDCRLLQPLEGSRRRQTPSRDRAFKQINKDKLEIELPISHKKATSEEKRFELPGLRKLSDSPCSKSAGSFHHKVFQLPMPESATAQARANRIISSPRDLSPGSRVRYFVRDTATSASKRNVTSFKSSRNSTGSCISSVPSDTTVRPRRDSRLRNAHNRVTSSKEIDLEFKKLKGRLTQLCSKQFNKLLQNHIEANENFNSEDYFDNPKSQPVSILKPVLIKKSSEQTAEQSFDMISSSNTPTQQLKSESVQEPVASGNTSKSPERYTTNHEALLLKVRSKPKAKNERKSGPARYLPLEEIDSATSVLKDLTFKQPSSLASDLKLLQEINGQKTKRILELDKFSNQVYNEIKPKINSILKKKPQQEDIPELIEWSSPDSSPVTKTVQFRV
jgi:hypothetical protein